MFYVYVLKGLVKNRYYIGYTNDINSRLRKHNNGGVRSTRKFRPWMLLGFEVYEKRNEARWLEHELKNHGTKRSRLIKSLEENIKQIA
jgi:putative endonuclease